jgi:hypothetical protein
MKEKKEMEERKIKQLLHSVVLERRFVALIYNDLNDKKEILFEKPIEFYIGSDLENAKDGKT